MKSFLQWLLDPLFVLLTRYMAGSGLMLCAFDKVGLARIGGDNRNVSPQLWTYRTNDALATVDTAGYFDNGATTNTGMRNHFAVGDLIWVFGSADTTPTGGLMMVNSNSAGIIDVASFTAIGTIDSD